MAANRWVSPVLLAAGLATLPACVTTFVNEPADHPTSTTKTGGPTDFGIYPKAPGERVALHPEAKTAAVAAEVPVPPPVDPPEVAPVPTVAASPPVDPPLVRIIRAYLDNRPDVAVGIIDTLDPAARGLLLKLVPVVVQAADLSSGKPHEVGELARQLEATAASLAAKAPLMIEKVCFCEEYKAFGHFKPLPNQQVLRPGRIAQLYLEVRNVPSEPTVDSAEGGGFVTKLVGAIELRDANGAVLELTDRLGKRVPKIQDTKNDFSRSPMRDYFVVFYFETPSKPGAYVVTVEVRDPQSGRAVSKPVSFRVQ
jgi:hypothetical protein